MEGNKIVIRLYCKRKNKYIRQNREKESMCVLRKNKFNTIGKYINEIHCNVLPMVILQGISGLGLLRII